jgi:hypothetical protein
MRTRIFIISIIIVAGWSSGGVVNAAAVGGIPEAIRARRASLFFEGRSPFELLTRTFRQGNLSAAAVASCVTRLGSIAYETGSSSRIYSRLGSLPHNVLFLGKEVRSSEPTPNRFWVVRETPDSVTNPGVLLSFQFDVLTGSLRLGREEFFFLPDRLSDTREFLFHHGKIDTDPTTGLRIFRANSTDGNFRVRLFFGKFNQIYGSLLGLALQRKAGFLKWETTISLFVDDVLGIRTDSYFWRLFRNPSDSMFGVSKEFRFKLEHEDFALGDDGRPDTTFAVSRILANHEAYLFARHRVEKIIAELEAKFYKDADNLYYDLSFSSEAVEAALRLIMDRIAERKPLDNLDATLLDILTKGEVVSRNTH